MKIVFSPDYWKKPANGLVKALQERLRSILEHPAENGVRDGESLKLLLTRDLGSLALKFPRSNPDHLKMTVFRNDGGWDHFTLSHRRDNIADTAYVWIVFGSGVGFIGGEPVSGPFGTIVIEF